jgi:hypothetical protein
MRPHGEQPTAAPARRDLVPATGAILRRVGDAATVGYARSSISTVGSASADLVFFD